ncbi:MAG: ribosomal-protein-alanine N-acetyltransferase [Halothiobacillaceae bacterium]|nr:MAG: ribosomal-protein-alanine N-acetyltransferase [Halothiobacillaceae bacterium]
MISTLSWPLKSPFTAGYYGVLLVDLHEAILAYSLLSYGAGEAHLLNLCVRPDRQRQGLGRQLLEHMVDVANRLGADTLLLEVRVSNRAATQLYSNMGFNEVGLRENYYPAADNRREDAIVLAKALL